MDKTYLFRKKRYHWLRPQDSNCLFRNPTCWIEPFCDAFPVSKDHGLSGLGDEFLRNVELFHGLDVFFNLLSNCIVILKVSQIL